MNTKNNTGRLLRMAWMPLSLLGLMGFAPAADDWVTTGSLNTPRGTHTATLLQDGRILVCGGTSSGATDTAEIYNPGTGLWSNTGSMNHPRTVHTATLLPNGRVLVTGGDNGGSLSTAEIYDPVSESWEDTPLMSSPRSAHKAVLLPSGRVLICAGQNNASFLASAELYDPVSGTWSSTGSLHHARHYPTATLLANGKVLVAGGHDGSSGLSSAEIYDPATGAWTTTGSMSGIRYHHAATLLVDGRVLATGGFNGSTAVATADLYDPVAGGWSAVGSMGTARHAHSATRLLDGRVLIAAGHPGNSTTSSAEIYDPGSQSFSSTASLNNARHYHSATLLLDGRVVVAGGNNETGNLATAELYQAVVVQPPTAVPGPNQLISQGQTVHLDGSGSYGFNTPGASLTYSWTFLSRPDGSVAILTAPNTSTPSFVADVAGTFIVQLVVIEPSTGLQSAPAQVTISSTFVPPVANAGAAQSAVVGRLVVLDGSASSDPNGLPLTYSWTIVIKPVGSAAALTGETSAAPSFVPDLAGSYTVTLVVSTAGGSSSPASVVVTAISGSDFAEGRAHDAVNSIAAMPDSQFLAPGQRVPLSQFLQQAIASLQAGDIGQAKLKLTSALVRTDGIPLRQAVDGPGPGMDWITDPVAQTALYQALNEALSVLP